MTSQLDLHVRMLEEERKESARLRDEQEKLRLEFISARAESDKVTREVHANINFHYYLDLLPNSCYNLL